MSPLWHGLSTIFLDEPRILASPAVVRMLLAGEGRAGLVYAGDRMWPAIRHGQEITVRPAAASELAVGDVVLALVGGVPDVLRVVRTGDATRCAADADRAAAVTLAPHEVLGRVEHAAAKGWIRGRLARARLDWAEAIGGGAEGATDPASSVREKYDEQAEHYARSGAEPLEPELRRAIASGLPAGGRVLVAGCGTGRETFAVEELGLRASGIDFSPRMITLARAEAARRGSKATFDVADLRTHVEPAGSLAAVLFTYEVFSFIPTKATRAAVLDRLRTWLAPDGLLFLSARLARGATARGLLGVQRLMAALRGRGGEWGDSHTRRIDAAGSIRRSFIHVFSARALEVETSAAGFRGIGWIDGHGVYRVAPGLHAAGRA